MINKKKLTYLFCFLSTNNNYSTKIISNSNKISSKPIKKQAFQIKKSVKGKKFTTFTNKIFNMINSYLHELNNEQNIKFNNTFTKNEELNESIKKSTLEFKEKMTKIFRAGEKKKRLEIEKARQEKEKQLKEKQELDNKKKEELAKLNQKLKNIENNTLKNNKVLKKIVVDKKKNMNMLSVLFLSSGIGLAMYFSGVATPLGSLF